MPWIQAATRPPGMQAKPRAAHDWYKISNVADDEAEILVYDEIGGWYGTLAEDFVRDLRAITARNLTVRINSPGGSFFDGVTIANALRAHPANVTCRIEGLCASAASIIAMAGDTVVAMPQTQLMIHDAIGGCYGNAADMGYMVDLLDRLSDSIADAYAAKAGGTRDEWRKRTRDETWYSPEEAVAAGLVDEAISMPQRQDGGAPEMRNAWDLSVFQYAGRDKAPAPVIPQPADTASPTHHTGTVEGTWDTSVHEKRLPSPMTVATAKKMYGWYDNSQVEDGQLPKSAGKLPHHEVSADGTPGAANLAGVRNALARLPQSDIPEAERAAVEKHLRAHLDDAPAATGGVVASVAPIGEVPTSTLTFNLGSALGEQLVAALRASVLPEPVEPAAVEPAAPESEPAATVEPEQPAEPEPVAEPEVAALEVPDAEPEPVTPVESAVPEPTEPEPEAVTDPTPEPTPIAAWQSAIAHLTTPAPDPWSAVIAHLIAPTSPSAATNALKEAS